MSVLRYMPLIWKQVWRHRVRSGLTVAGVGVAMFLFCAVIAMEQGVKRATELTSEDATLVVYRENRYCPFTSRLPQWYKGRIESVDGVSSVVPMRIHVSNCRASLDVVTFRGVPEEDFVADHARGLKIIGGTIEEWQRRSDSALVGESLAARRGLKVGDRFSAAGITVHVAGVIASDEPQDRNVAYVHLAFIQESVKRGGTGGIVTQFNVRVDDPAQLEPVAASIDRLFASEQEPTMTRPEKAFVADAASDVLAIARFAGWLGWGALAAVFALVGNAIVLAVQDRVREHAIMRTLGFGTRLLGAMIVGEGLVLGVFGGAVGAIGAFWFLRWNRFSLTMEGVNIEFAAEPGVVAMGLVASVAIGVLAGLVPAWQVSRREIASSFRAV